MADPNEVPKIHIDSDWKAQARAEKEKLAEKAKPTPGATSSAPGAPGAGRAAGAAGQRGLPPATFETLVSTTATQALFALGAIPDPRTGQRMMSLDLARHHIDMLSVIEQKTKGNLSAEETQLLTTTLYELRQRYIQMAASARGAGG